MRLAKKFAPSAVRWVVALGSVAFFLTWEDLPGVILQTNYGQPAGWKDVAVAAGLMKGPE